MDELTKKDCCIVCGGDLQPDPRTGIPTCIYCGRQYKDATEGFSAELQEISNLRQLREFIKAEELCEGLLSRQPESSEAHWQLVLAKLGIVYVQEGEHKKPTFFSCSYSARESILADKNYLAAIENAKSAEDRAYYTEKGRELDVLLKEFFLLTKKEENYDIFISFKHTTLAVVDGHERSIETDDYRKACEIYEHLKHRYRVFFSPVSIGEDTGIQGEKYEPRILKALQTSQAMILIGFSEANLKAQWVENEWRRYKYYIEKAFKQKNSLIYVYEKQMHLPPALREIQWPNVDVYDAKYLEKLDRLIEFVKSSKGIRARTGMKNVNADFSASTEAVGFGTTARAVIRLDKAGKEAIAVDSTEERAIQTAEGMLGHRKWKDAERQFQQILRRNPESAPAYWGIFKAHIHAENDMSVSTVAVDATPEDLTKYMDKAVENSPGANYSWSILDRILDVFKNEHTWEELKPLYVFLIRYLDYERIRKMHGYLSELLEKYVALRKPKVAEDIYEHAQQIFIDEARADSIALMKEYAIALHDAGYYGMARRYLEKLAGVESSSENYLSLLATRLKTPNPTEAIIKLNVDDSDDSGTKAISDLDIDEIIERIVICDNKERSGVSGQKVWRLSLPKYKVYIGHAKSKGAIVSLLREKTGMNPEEAETFVRDHKLISTFDTEEAAQAAARDLDRYGIDWEVGEVEGTAATISGLITALSRARGTTATAADRHIRENNLLPRVFLSEAEADAVANEYGRLGVSVDTLESKEATGSKADMMTESYRALRAIVLYQIRNNHKEAHPLLETLVSVYRHPEVGDKERLLDIMRLAADSFVTERDFKQADTWYRELLAEDSNDATAHWGTLKCHLGAVDDYDVQRHAKKLMTYQEFNNAINCADNQQHSYYMSVYYNDLPARPKEKEKRRSTPRTASSLNDLLMMPLRILLSALEHAWIFVLLTLVAAVLAYPAEMTSLISPFPTALVLFVLAFIRPLRTHSRLQKLNRDPFMSHPAAANRAARSHALTSFFWRIVTILLVVAALTATLRSQYGFGEDADLKVKDDTAIVLTLTKGGVAK